jgi:hypothetical protein
VILSLLIVTTTLPISSTLQTVFESNKNVANRYHLELSRSKIFLGLVSIAAPTIMRHWQANSLFELSDSVTSCLVRQLHLTSRHHLILYLLELSDRLISSSNVCISPEVSLSIVPHFYILHHFFGRHISCMLCQALAVLAGCFCLREFLRPPPQTRVIVIKDRRRHHPGRHHHHHRH